MLEKILVPLDGSELAAKILLQVEDLAKKYDAHVTLMTVGHSATAEEMGEASPEVIREAAAHERRASERYLKKATDALKEKGLTVDWVYKEGMPSWEIVTYAAANEMDLIALATHGRGAVAWVLGSVAEKVVRRATVPVLLLRVMEYKPPMLKEQWFKGA